MTALEMSNLLRQKGCYYNQEKGGIYSKNNKRKGHMGTNGYRVVLLQVDKKEYYCCEHRVVWWWFHPDTDESLVIDHLNCQRDDNRIENLEAVTQQENMRRTAERDRQKPCYGELSPKTQLMDRDALAIKYLAQQGYPRKDIAAWIVGDKSKHPQVTVNRILEGTRFGHLKDPSEMWMVYPAIVAATARTDLPVEAQIENCAMGLAGELGEVVDILKKYLFQGHELDKDALMEELGDLLFYYTWMAVLIFGFDRAEIMLRNLDKLIERYPKGFEAERSINRPEYAISAPAEYTLTRDDLTEYGKAHPAVYVMLNAAMIKTENGINYLEYPERLKVYSIVVSRRLDEIRDWVNGRKEHPVQIEVRVINDAVQGMDDNQGQAAAPEQG